MSPNSELIVDVNTNGPHGLINTLVNVTVWELPLVTLFPSGIDWVEILIPGFKLTIENS